MNTEPPQMTTPAPEKALLNRVSLKADKTGEVLIYDTIGQDWWTGEGVTAKGFQQALKSLGDVALINLRINSPGGDVFEGSAIYTLLNQHPAKIVVHIDGLAASMATIVAMTGDEIHMAANALFMIHEPRAVAVGTAEEMLATVDLLDKISQSAVDVYAARSGQDKATIKKQMQAETWFSAEEAKAAGFVTSVTPNKQLTAHFDVSSLRAKAPEWAQARLREIVSQNPRKEAVMPDPTLSSAVAPAATPPAPAAVAPAATPAPVATSAPLVDPVAAERDRCTEITSMCMLAKKPQLAAGFIKDPHASLASVSRALLTAVCQDNPPVGEVSLHSPDKAKGTDPNAKYRDEYKANQYLATVLSEDEYIQQRRIDDKLDPLVK